MAARTTREGARQRLRAVFEKALDQVIPEDSMRPLKGQTFLEWEHQADEFDREVTGALLEERAALEASALVEPDDLGRCRHCGSDRLYLQRSEPTNRTRAGTHGPVVRGFQSVRCRSCGRSFSPSGA
jgi:DNA-directed RNA polymerase subunit RPC12/RpoP